MNRIFFSELICYVDVNLAAKRRRHTSTPLLCVICTFYFILFYFNCNNSAIKSSTIPNAMRCFLCHQMFYFRFGHVSFQFYSNGWETRQNAPCACATIQYVIPMRTDCVRLVFKCIVKYMICECLWFDVHANLHSN